MTSPRIRPTGSIATLGGQVRPKPGIGSLGGAINRGPQGTSQEGLTYDPWAGEPWQKDPGIDPGGGKYTNPEQPLPRPPMPNPGIQPWGQPKEDNPYDAKGGGWAPTKYGDTGWHNQASQAGQTGEQEKAWATANPYGGARPQMGGDIYRQMGIGVPQHSMAPQGGPMAQYIPGGLKSIYGQINPMDELKKGQQGGRGGGMGSFAQRPWA